MVVRSNFPRTLFIKSCGIEFPWCSKIADKIRVFKNFIHFSPLLLLRGDLSTWWTKFDPDLPRIGLRLPKIGHRLREFLINVPGNHKMRLSCHAIISGSLVEFLYFCVDGYQTGL